jgi:UDP-N-acetylglucosamine--N-acetylmuramyl-(pentapeptide) pyrophosphoryl-undecaprenol N-acetylglucosamine transferase
MRVIISGGGTGGHIFPAVAIADAIVARQPNTEVLFVGANGRMEMDRVPAAGYKIMGLDIAGVQRKMTVKNLLLPFKLVKSLLQARSIVKSFKPDIAIGVGGYASGPLLQICGWMGLPYILQEQNSYAGVTNKILGKNAKKIFVAYEDMYKFFPKEKITLVGNPIRKDIANSTITQKEALVKLNLDVNKKTILISGGSLGARTLNDAINHGYTLLKDRNDIQLLWQVGKLYYEEFSNAEIAKLPHVRVMAFIDDMAACYAAADVIVCRAGALTISELGIVGKPSILVPSPNVAEDHQTHNAMSLVNKGAAEIVKDSEAKEKLVGAMLQLLDDQDRKQKLTTNLLKLGKTRAADEIADYVIETIKKAV